MIKKISFCLVLAFVINFSVYAEPKNLEVTRAELLNYYHSGNYFKEISNQTDKGQKILEQALRNNSSNKKLAVVFDIDETVLSNFKRIETLLNLVGYSGDTISKNQMKILTSKFRDSAIKPTLKLYQYAVKNHYTVFFITGRHEPNRFGTVKNLKDAGYTKWDHLFLREPNQYKLPPVQYKSTTRAEIEKQGYDIVLNIGDQFSDLQGGHADHTIKLPNPYYFIK